MAEKNPESPKPTAAGGKAKGGIGAYLPLILIVVLAPTGALLTMRFMSPGAKKAATASAASPAPTHNASEAAPKMKAKAVSSAGRQLLKVPLTNTSLGFHLKKNVGKLSIMDVNGDSLGEGRADKIVVNVANTRGARVIVARLTIEGEDPPLLQRFNENRGQLLEIVSSTLSNKTLEEVSKVGITNQLRAELVAAFNGVLGSGTIQDVSFLEFEVRSR